MTTETANQFEVLEATACASAPEQQSAAPTAAAANPQERLTETSAALVLGDIAAIERAIEAEIGAASAAGAGPDAQSPIEFLASDVAGATTDSALGAEVGAASAAPAGGGVAGLFNDQSILTGAGADQFVASRLSVGVDAGAIGIENRGVISTAGGVDLIAGAGIAIGTASAEAFGVLNEGAIDMGADADTLMGVASATGFFGGPVSGSAIAFGYSENEPLGAAGGSSLRMGDGADRVIGVAEANGTEDVGAFGLVFENADTGEGNDTVEGKATATGKGSTEARSISVGVSDVDDDALSPPDVTAVVGSLVTGSGNDLVRAETRLTVNAGPDDQVFFAGANGVVVDGGAEAQWIAIVTANAATLAAAAAAQAAGDRFAVTRALQPLLAQIDTSTLDMGAGSDTLISSVMLEVNGLGFEVDPEDDLEVIADAIENAGTLLMGDGDDRLEITNDVRSTIDGAKAFADALDNASIGVNQGYTAIATQVLTDLGLIGAGSANPQVSVIEVEVNYSTRFDLGAGNDTIVTRTFASAIDDIPSADGLSNRGLWVGGNGSETLDLNNVTVFAVGEILNGGNDGEQREGISDGWESRGLIFMDDVVVLADGTIVEGSTIGDGADLVRTDATAFGNGVLTIADGFEGRDFTNTGGGNDTFDVTGRAFTTARAVQDTFGILASNVTAATGLQTEQVDEGDFLMRSGNDRVIGRALAAPALGLDPFAFDPADFAPETFDPNSDLFANRTTIAQGISQVTADVLAVNDGSRDLGVIDTSGATGVDNDLLDGAATAFGVSDVQSYGILLTNAVTGRGLDTLTGSAEATGRNVAFANGVAVGISANTDNDGRTLRPDQAGLLSTGSEADLLTATATATTFTDGARRIATGLGDGTVVVSEANADSNGLLVDLRSTLDLGTGNDRITASASAFDLGIGGVNTAVTADGVENRGSIVTGSGNDSIVGSALATSDGGVLLTLTGGIDNGFGSTRNNIPLAPTISTGDGADVLDGVGAVVAFSGIGLASGIETSGFITTGGGADTVSGVSTATVTNGINAVADGIENSDIAGLGAGVIETGSGNDRMFARATATGVNTNAEAIAIRNDFVDLVNGVPQVVIAEGRIDLGGNDDVIDAFAAASSDTKQATAIGIRGGTVLAGSGADSITAGSTQLLAGDNGVLLAGGRGLGGDVLIDMGSGNDTLAAFGQASATGGTGADTLIFAFSLEDFLLGGGEIVLGAAATTEVDFSFGGETLSTDRFELFCFADVPTPLSYGDLMLV